MPENGRSEREAQGFHEPKTPGGWIGLLAVVSTISVVVAAFWVMGPDARSGSKTLSSPSPASSPSSEGVPVDLDERTIYLWDTASGDMRDLVSGPGLSDPELSPSGAGVVYEREEANGITQVYLLHPGGFEHRLTDLPSGASDPTWSPDGRIAFSATPAKVTGIGRGTDIFVMDADGSHVRRIAGTRYDDQEPDWSPDGSRIAFHSRADDDEAWLWVASTRTHSLKELGVHGRWSAAEPAWSPDGRWVAYIRYHHANTMNGNLDSPELWRVRSDGTDDRRITTGTDDPRITTGPQGLIPSNPSWSPDGRLIVYEQDDFKQDDFNWGGRRVSVSNVRTGLARPFLSGTPGGWWVGFEPSWSGRGILVIRPSADPILTRPRIPKRFLSDPVLGGPGVAGTITMSASTCELTGVHRPIRPGRLKLELVNDSPFEARFTLVKLRGPIHNLQTHPPHFLFRRARQRSLDPWSVEVWSSTDRTEPGRWAVACDKDKVPSPNGIFIVPVGVAGPIDVA